MEERESKGVMKAGAPRRRKKEEDRVAGSSDQSHTSAPAQFTRNTGSFGGCVCRGTGKQGACYFVRKKSVGIAANHHITI